VSLVKRKKKTDPDSRWNDREWAALWRSVAPIGLWTKGGKAVGLGDWREGEVLWKPALRGEEHYYSPAVWSRVERLVLPISGERLQLWNWRTAHGGEVDRALTRTMVRWMDQEVAGQKALADWAWRHGESEPLRLQGLTVLGALRESGPREDWMRRTSYGTRERRMWLAKLLQAEAWAETWTEGG